MNNYTDFLTKEETIILCDIITGREFKELFKRNEKEFSKLCKGFRAKSLTEERALSVAISNIDKPFILFAINTKVELWLKEIAENIEKLVNEGLSYDIALATTMLDSYFEDHVDLYLKLAEKESDVSSCTELIVTMRRIKADREKDAEVTERIKALEKEKQELSNQIEEARQNVRNIQAEYEQKILKIEEEKSTLANSLVEAQDKIAELQATPPVEEDTDAEYLAMFDDTKIAALPPVIDDEIVSLCRVTTDYNGRKWLIRCADLGHNGRYSTFYRREDITPYFTNRDKLFYMDGPSTDGFFGVWRWSAIPNQKDSSKDYVTSIYNNDIMPIEVVIITEASNLENLINMLKTGINFQPRSYRIMFTVYATRGQYTGILCNTKELDTTNGKTRFLNKCNVVPVYEFSGNDIIRMGDGTIFYANAFAGMPSKLYQLKSSLDIVRDIVLSSVSWEAYKARKGVQKDYKAIKNFMNAIPVEDVTYTIEKTCRCSNPTAIELLNQFIDVCWKYIEGDTLEDEIILSAISASDELQERTKELIRADWEVSNKNLLDEAQKELDSLKREISAANVALTEAQEALHKTKVEEERLSGVIEENEKLAEDVETKVAERIQAARENAAEFIANMAFMSEPRMSVKEVSATEIVPSETTNVSYHVIPRLADISDLEVHHNWRDVINTTAQELGEAGVIKQYQNSLAAFLCAAYIEKQPIILVGPNANDIAQAFAAAVAGHKHGELYCADNNYRQEVIGIGSETEDIVIIENLLGSSWMNMLPELLSQKKIFYVATHPYAEDIQVEPKSLYGFMMPLFTEIFVDRKANGGYYGGCFADDFIPYEAQQAKYRDMKILSKFSLNALTKNSISKVITTMHSIYSATTVDDEFLLAVFPIAYATMQIDQLADALSNPQNGLTISAGLKRDLHYILGDI